MTQKQETDKAVAVVMKCFQAFYGRIFKKDILLLETGFDGDDCDYILFRNRFTGADFRITGNPKTGDYTIEEITDD